jgi:hypothetical protein
MSGLNPLLQNLRLPGETVRLPSKALYYSSEIVTDDVKKDGELHVYPMTTYEELLMKTPDLLYSGQAIIQTFARCIPQILDPLQMYSKDIDFLLIALRKVTYGSEITINYTHTCEDAEEHEYTYNVDQFIRSSKSIEGSYQPQDSKITLKNGQVVTVRPFILQDVIDASQRSTSTQFDGMSELEFVMAMKDIIVGGIGPAITQVDEVVDREMITEWLEALPPPLISELSSKIDKINQFGAIMDVEVTCQDCGEKLTINVPLNPQSFFTLPSAPAIEN